MSIPQHEETIRPEWIDSNGHMNLAYYIVVFDHALDTAFEALDIGTGYRQRTGNSSFAVETHTLYEREVGEGDLVRVTTRVLGAHHKRLHLFQEMFHAGQGHRVAAHEQMCLHIDMRTRRVAAWPQDRQAVLRAAVQEQEPLGMPRGAGRRIELRSSASRG